MFNGQLTQIEKIDAAGPWTTLGTFESKLDDYMVTAADLKVLKQAIVAFQTNLESTKGQDSEAHAAIGRIV